MVTVDPARQAAFEARFQGLACAAVGTVTADPVLVLRAGERTLASLPVDRLIAAWKQPFGE